MCGFVGFLLSPEIQLPDLESWSDCIRHRGPDQGGQAANDGFGIGTRRLSILDLSDAGSQPMQTARYVLGFNGEIYNHRELRAELQTAGVTNFVSSSDTETILRGIEHWGLRKTLNRLNGMYALAIWDKQRQELTLARDPLGIKPLLYIHRQHELYFASELKALRPYSTGAISHQGLALYLILGFTPAPYSLLDDVRKVQPGEAITFSQTGVQSTQIVPLAWVQAPELAPQYHERMGQVREMVEAAIRRQLLSDVPVGLFLSGGVDSSIIAAVASAHCANLSSFSIRPTTTFADPGAQQDAEIAARFARKLGLNHYEVLVQPDTIVSAFTDLLTQIDEPVSEIYFAAEVLLSRTARAAGVPVVLTGHGGDEVFLGYPTYQALVKGDCYDRVPFFGPLAQTLAHVPYLAPNTRENLLGAASVWRKSFAVRYALISAVHFALDEAATLTGLPLDEVRQLLQTVVLNTQKRVEILPQRWPFTSAELFARMDMLLKVPEHYNMRLDKATMVASVEARVPLQDLELIGFAMHLPQADLMRGGVKGLLKQAFADLLPTEVLQRPKQTFQAPLLSWLRGPLASWVTEQLTSLSPVLPAATGLLDPHPRSTKQAYRTWCLGLIENWRIAMQLEY